MAELFWLPYPIVEWNERTRELSCEQEGALMRLIRHAWAAADPCTIADSEDAFDRVLGSRWKRLVPLIRQHFTPAADQPGRLRCEWLFVLYQAQLAKHHSYQTRGALGGRPRKSSDETSASDNQAPPDSSATSSGFRKRGKKKAELVAERKALSRENTTEGKSSGPLQAHRAFPPPSDALALEAARAAGGNDPPNEPHDFDALVEAAFPEQTAARQLRDRGSTEAEAALAWYDANPELVAAITARVDAFPAQTEYGRDRIRRAAIVDAWRQAGSPARAAATP